MKIMGKYKMSYSYSEYVLRNGTEWRIVGTATHYGLDDPGFESRW